MIITNKKQIATTNLDTAIELFFDGKIIPSINLASASEEVLGCLCKEAGIDNVLKKMVEIAERQTLPNKKIIDLLNETKNEIKHADKNTGEIEIDDLEAQLMIRRAVSNFISLGYVTTPEISKFIQWAMNNPMTKTD